MVFMEQLLVDPQGNMLEEELDSTEEEDDEEDEESEELPLEQPSSQELQMQLLVGPAGQRMNPHSQHSVEEEEEEEELEELELEEELRGRINSQWGLQGFRPIGLHPLDEEEDESEDEEDEEEEDSLAGLTGLR